MKKYLGHKRLTGMVDEEKITDALIGTGEHMCTCAALVADIIIGNGQEEESVRELMRKLKEDGLPAEQVL